MPVLKNMLNSDLYRLNFQADARLVLFYQVEQTRSGLLPGFYCYEQNRFSLNEEVRRAIIRKLSSKDYASSTKNYWKLFHFLNFFHKIKIFCQSKCSKSKTSNSVDDEIWKILFICKLIDFKCSYL